MSELHPATRGFAAADVYERGRPDYPAAAIARIVEKLELRPGRTVLDLAAGTGKLTAPARPERCERRRGRAAARDARRARAARAGGRGARRDRRADPARRRLGERRHRRAAFHWFDADQALARSIACCEPGGGLALVWNARDERDPLQAALSDVIDPLVGDTPRRTQRDWKTMLAESGLFERCERKLFEHEQLLDEQGVVDRVASISFIATSLAPVRADVEAQVRALVRDAEQPIRLPYMTEVYFGVRAAQLTDGSSGIRETSS